MKPIHLRARREQLHLTQEELEDLSGVAQSVISRLENESDIDPAFSTVSKLAAALKVKPETLRFGRASDEAAAS